MSESPLSAELAFPHIILGEFDSESMASVRRNQCLVDRVYGKRHNLTCTTEHPQAGNFDWSDAWRSGVPVPIVFVLRTGYADS